MLRPPRPRRARPQRARPRRVRPLAALLAALLAAPALAVGSASAAQADAVRQQELWVLNAMNVAGAWQHTRGSGVTVALIDSGVNGQVSDLAGSVITGRDFSGVNTPPTDPNWGVHGTWMASLIAGHGHAPGGTSGITGIAPAARILSIRAVTDQGDPGYRHYQHESEARVQAHLAAAIRYATSKRVNVISMSLGYQGASLPVRVAIAAALAKGIVVVASSGNSGGTSISHTRNAPYSFPADYPGVLGVGAIRQSGMPAGFSSDNLSVQVAAPGVRVPAQGRDGQYWLVSGTSPACALTAGVAALIKSVHPGLAPALVVQAITASTSNKPRGGYDEEVGFGTVNATAALRMASRLARDRGTGRGLAAAAKFGGGPGAVPPVPVAPRSKGQLLIDSLIALACLAVILVVAYRLIATRGAAVAGVPAGVPGGSGAPGGWGPGSGGPDGRANPQAPGGWVDAGAPGPGASGVNGGRPEAGGTGYGRSAGYWAAGGYKPPAVPQPDVGYGQTGALQPPADPAPPPGYGSPREYGAPPGHGAPAGHGAPGEYGAPAGHGAPGEYGAPGDYQRPMVSGPPPGFEPLADPGPPVPGPPMRYGAPEDYWGWTGSAPSAGSGLPEGYPGPAGSMRPTGAGVPGAYDNSAGSAPSAGSGPTDGSPGDPPAAKPVGPPVGDDTWPSSSAW
jgi:hypothetical protein